MGSVLGLVQSSVAQWHIPGGILVQLNIFVDPVQPVSLSVKALTPMSSAARASWQHWLLEKAHGSRARSVSAAGDAN